MQSYLNLHTHKLDTQNPLKEGIQGYTDEYRDTDTPGLYASYTKLSMIVHIAVYFAHNNICTPVKSAISV